MLSERYEICSLLYFLKRKKLEREIMFCVRPSVRFTIINTPTHYTCMWKVKIKVEAAHDMPGQA
jgi:hypothetical protein